MGIVEAASPKPQVVDRKSKVRTRLPAGRQDLKD
jgi:hypothetical protein